MLEIEPLTNDQMIARATKFYRHVKHILKGFIQADGEREYYYGLNGTSFLEELDCPPGESSYPSFQGRLKVTHRSIYEFLRNDCPQAKSAFVKSFDVRSAILQSIIAHIKLFQWDLHILRVMHGEIMNSCLSWLRASLSDKHLKQMDILDGVLIQAQAGSKSISEIDWFSFRGFAPVSSLGYASWNDLVSITSSSLALGFTESFSWKRENRVTFFNQDRTRAELCKCLLDSILYGSKPASLEVLRQLTSNRFVSRKILEYPLKSLSKNSLWQNFVCRVGQHIFLQQERDVRISNSLARALEFLLQAQVDPRITFNFTRTADVMYLSANPPSYDLSRTYLSEVLVLCEPRAAYEPYFDPSEQDEFVMNKGRYEQLQPSKTFRELIEQWNVQNCQKLLRLIDRNVELLENPTELAGLGTPLRPKRKRLQTVAIFTPAKWFSLLRLLV
ncbi:hypothetical protein BKA65DRAFT_542836 [Rhexocercosporidium sp. MPI-PUGE-AT-0058]|nr:hypothetical protein BKA65DRAFT_542836 [Rhexocercosporidium sp. MPI-PUGE-AT-0058]